MKIEDDTLMSYLVKHLQPLTDADPYLLANFVAALLKDNKSEKELQALCVNQLLDFLGDESKSFVVNLFHVLEDGSIIMQQDNHGTEHKSLAQASTTPKTGENMESRASQFEKPPKANMGMFSDHEDHEEDVSDVEDDDRNHKHRRHVSRSCSPDKDIYEEYVRKRSRPAINSQPELGISRSNDDVHMETYRPAKKRPGRDYMYSDSPRLGCESSLHGMARRPSAFRYDGTTSMFDSQNGLSRVSGRGRGGNPLLWAREQRIASLDGFDHNIPIHPGPSSTYAGRTSFNSGQSSWAGYAQFNGVTNSALDQTMSLNKRIQGSRGVSVSATLGVGIPFGRPWCLDFEERGYCLRGDLCPLEHGENRIVVKDVQSLSKFNLPMAHSSGRSNALGSASTSVSYPMNVHSLDKTNISKGALVANTEPDLYDPDQPLWNKSQSNDGLKKLPLFRRSMEDNVLLEQPVESNANELKCDVSQDLAQGKSIWHHAASVDTDDIEPERMAPSIHFFQHAKVSVKLENNEEKYEERTRMSDVDNISDKGRHPTDKGSFNPHNCRNAVSAHERAFRTLFVSCIPRNINKKELLKAHFQKFGEIANVRIPSQSDRAFVQFLQSEDAEAALKSPEAVMGNRFIRLSWAKRDSSRAPFAQGTISTTQKGASEADSQKGEVLQPSPQGEKQRAMVQPTLNVSKKEIVISTLEPSSSQKKREELEHLKEELQKKQEDLAQRRDEFRRKLQTLSKQNVGITGEIDKEELRDHSNNSIVKTEGMLDEAMKRSVSDKGLQIDESEVSSLASSSSAQLCSGNNAQSSRSARMQPSQLVACSGSSHRGPFWYKIDNRTTVFRIVPPFPDNFLDLMTLKEHFLHYGDTVNVELEEVDEKVDGYRVTFSSRSAAELAFTQGKWFQGISLQFCWVNASSSIASASSTGNRNVESVGYSSATKSPEESKSSKTGRSTAENEVSDHISNIGVAEMPERGHDPCLEMNSLDNIGVDSSF